MPDIRRLDENDRPQWLALRTALYPDHAAAELDGEITHLLGDPLEAGFGAFEEGKLIGFVEVSERPWGDGCETAPVGWVESILIVPDKRRNGIARLLVDATANWSRTRGLQELGSDVLMENGPSLSAHLTWGFEETKRVVMFRKRL